MRRKEILQRKSPLFPCYLGGDGVEGEETIALGGVWEVAGLGGDLVCDSGMVDECGGGFDEQEFAGGTGLEIDALRLEVPIVRAVRLGETIL